MILKNVVLKPGINLKGEVVIPPSKSLSHRGIIAASLAEGVSEVDNIINSKDIIATIGCVRQINVNADYKDNKYMITGNGGNFEVEKSPVFECNESGSTLRFMIPIGSLASLESEFHGEGQLRTRPLDPFFKIFDKQNLSYEYNNSLPLKLNGKLVAGTYDISGDVSSQFITGLMYTLPLLDGDSVINITTNLESKGYLDLTMDVLEEFGIEVENLDYKQFKIKGNQKFKNKDYRVEGDYSQVAFWIVAGLINGSITCSDMRKESKQGDKEVLEIVERMKGDLKFIDDKIIVNKSDTQATIIDGSQCPDIIPVLTVLAAVTKGETRVINASRLRIKECDRLNAITTELNKLGANIQELEDGLIINGVDKLTGGKVSGWNDHRIVMSLAVASLVCEEEVYIEGADAITKSYPHFFEQFTALGGIVNEWHLEK